MSEPIMAERAKGDQVLIEAGELREQLAGDRPPLVLDVRWAGPGATDPGAGADEFAAGHIPGSQWVDLEADLAAAPTGPGGRHPLPTTKDFEAAMRRHGVRDDRAVVVLDGANSLAAGRLWWQLRDAGLPEVRVLDGGFAAWRASGGPVETGPAEPVEPGDFVARSGALPAVDADGVSAAAATVWDVRTPERYRGESEPIDPVAGHIPGARNLPSVENHRSDGSFRSPDELRANFADVRPGDVVYCGSGVTAAQVLLAMAYAGVDGVRLYPGSWSDWISDPDRPVAMG